MADEPKKEKKAKAKEPDITFFHPDLCEVPDGDPKKAYLKGFKCKACGQIDFPKLDLCPNCWGSEFETFPLSRTGKLYSYSDLSIGAPGYPTPYIIGYIDLPDNIRILCQLQGEVGSFKCDEEVELTLGEIRKNADGLPLITYKFTHKYS